MSTKIVDKLRISRIFGRLMRGSHHAIDVSTLGGPHNRKVSNIDGIETVNVDRWITRKEMSVSLFGENLNLHRIVVW